MKYPNDVPCPACNASIGQLCTQIRRSRIKTSQSPIYSHKERWALHYSPTKIDVTKDLLEGVKLIGRKTMAVVRQKTSYHKERAVPAYGQGTVSHACKHNRHSLCTKLTCSCECGHRVGPNR